MYNENHALGEWFKKANANDKKYNERRKLPVGDRTRCRHSREGVSASADRQSFVTVLFALHIYKKFMCHSKCGQISAV